ncbi:MAG: hypothetical protein IJA86_09820 [Clostridia bacterium]|nr:hypothetical protein [Clostridia bacterium]
MKTKISFIAILLLMAMLLGSCTSTPDLPQNREPPISDRTTETPPEKPADPFESLRSSSEEWISYGLAAFERGKQVENLKEFFSDRKNMTYLTLYDHFFTYDKEKSVPVAEALFAFIYNEYGVEALLDLNKRCEYKSAYLKSLGLEIEYSNAPEVEIFLASMNFSSDATYKYIISFDNVTYYFEDFSAGSPSQYHSLLYYSTTGLFEMIEYLKSNNLNEGLDTERKFNYYMTFDGSGYSKTLHSNGNMYINNSSSTLHEAVHAMGITKNNNIWLSEGICNYFGISLGFNDQIAESCIQILTMAKQGYFDGNAQYILYKRLYEDYSARGGKMDSVDTFDFRLFTDVQARMELDTNTYKTLGDAYKIVEQTDCNAVGNELSYEQATSLVLYLVDTYGIEKVLEAYHSQEIEAAFGKGYEDLKADWLAYLYN